MKLIVNCPNCHQIINKYTVIIDKYIDIKKNNQFSKIIKKINKNIKKISKDNKIFCYECDDCSTSIKIYFDSQTNLCHKKHITYIQNEYKITDIISVGIVVNEYFYTYYNKKYNNDFSRINKKIRVIIKGKPFLQCSIAIAQFTKEEAEDENTDNMDDHLKAHGIKNLEAYKAQITLEEELFVHASNIQAFVENDYNMGILLESYSIPLLKELVKIGDKKAEYALYEQIVKKWNEGGNNQKIALFDKFPKYIIELVNNDVIPIYDFIINNFKFFNDHIYIYLIYFNKLYSNLPKKIKKYIYKRYKKI